MMNKSGSYCVIGPYLSKNILAEIKPYEDSRDACDFTLPLLRDQSIEAYYAEWLITGRPKVMLLMAY